MNCCRTILDPQWCGLHAPRGPQGTSICLLERAREGAPNGQGGHRTCQALTANSLSCGRSGECTPRPGPLLAQPLLP